MRLSCLEEAWVATTTMTTPAYEGGAASAQQRLVLRPPLPPPPPPPPLLLLLLLLPRLLGILCPRKQAHLQLFEAAQLGATEEKNKKQKIKILR